MGGPKVNLGAWKREDPAPIAGAPAPPVPQVGVQDFAALLPISEGADVGEPPVAPVLVMRVASMAASRVRRLRCASGLLVTCPIGHGVRARYSVAWPAMTAAQREAMFLWVLGVAGPKRNPWLLRIDGGDVQEAQRSAAVFFAQGMSIGEIAEAIFEGSGVEVMVAA